MSPDRTFYGGENPNDVIGGTGDVGGPRHYTGERPPEGPWKCPACKADQFGPLADGCTACGSGAVKPFRITTPAKVAGPVTRAADRLAADLAESNLFRQERAEGPNLSALRADMKNALDVYQYALNWSGANPDATLADAFIAGFQYANAKTIGAPPVSVDVPALSVEGKPRRTIIAALQHFREQILPRAMEEIASGEWCSLDEVDELIQQLSDEEKP